MSALLALTPTPGRAGRARGVLSVAARVVGHCAVRVHRRRLGLACPDAIGVPRVSYQPVLIERTASRRRRIIPLGPSQAVVFRERDGATRSAELPAAHAPLTTILVTVDY